MTFTCIQNCGLTTLDAEWDEDTRRFDFFQAGGSIEAGLYTNAAVSEGTTIIFEVGGFTSASTS